MAADGLLCVEVVYAQADAQEVVSLRVDDGTSVGEAVARSGILEKHPQLAGAKVGIFGRVVVPDTMVRDADRIEFYRPLVADPKLARRRRATRKI